MDISSLIELPDDLLDSLSGGTILRSHPRRWAFLDTETTGLAGGAGTYAFLVGVGSIDEEGFRVRQFFMRDFGDESSLLAALTGHLSRFDVLVTYNGQIVRCAAARNPLPHGPRAASFRPPGSPGSAARREAAVEAATRELPAWWTWKIRSWAWNAKAICPAR